MILTCHTNNLIEVSMNILLSRFLILTAIILIILSVVGIKHKTVSGARAFAILLIAMAIHSIGYGVELISTTEESLYFWVCIEYIGAAFYPILILWFAREYAEEKQFANRFVLAFILGLNLLTLIFVCTNQLHGWYYSSLGINFSLGFPLLVTGRGIWYLVQLGSFYFAIGYALTVFFKCFLKAPIFSRKRIALMFTGMLIPAITSILYLMGLGPAFIELPPFTYLLLSIFVARGLYQYDILFLSEITHEMVFNTIEEAVIVIDHDGFILNLNQATDQLFNTLGVLNIGNNVNMYPVLSELLVGNMAQLITIEQQHYQVRMIPIAKHHGLIVVFTDVTEITNTKKQLEVLATTDQLTGLYNRRYFIDYFDKLENDGVMIFLDIDEFKKVNDQYGHSSGDQVLIELSVCLQEYFPDGIICRLGGEEFSVLIENETTKTIYSRSEQFLHAFDHRKTDFPCTVSIGLCPYEQGNYNNTIDMVDKLLYQAKNTGKNRVVASDN
ncbi:diguanylate cyclase [Acetobacterium tundrae]|uniref:Diguanylate cyclase n=2 Tax=Acetobacterium tundrae TaxID=132932 RepID=A0ABR6WIN6_9FIRM|nr:diguanylate cyclase [Acetobacterium tundrae]